MNEKLSLCCTMIAKNSESTIEKALRSVIPICSQIVVVDTGSFDSTPSIATRLGAEVHYFEWINSFSEARNYALKFVRAEWVLILDSDEELVSKSLLSNTNLFSLGLIGGIKALIRNYLKDTNSESDSDNLENTSVAEHRYTRIFRLENKDGLKLPIKFVGKIHEQVSDSIYSSGYKIVESDIIINHYGYFDKNNEKIKRNLELIKSEIKSNPNDLWMLFHLGETVFNSGDMAESEKIFSGLLNNYREKQLSEFPIEHYEMTRLRLAQIEIQRNNYIKSTEYLDFISESANREGFRIYLITVSNLLSGNFALAKNMFEKNLLHQTNMISLKQLNDLKLAIEQIDGLKIG